MDTTMLSPEEWAKVEFAGAKFKDIRRSKRLQRLATGLVQRPDGNLTKVLPTWAELKGAYRFLGNKSVSYEEIIKPHITWTRERCRESGEYLLIEDTSVLDFSGHPATEGLGRIGDDRGRGLLLHTSLAVRIEKWEDRGLPIVRLLGLFGQKCWVRADKIKGELEDKKARLNRARESACWSEALAGTGGAPSGSRWIYVADRESDIYEVYLHCQALRSDFVVRATQPRRLEEAEGSVFDAVRKSAVLGQYSVKLRARSGRRGRVATVEIRARRIKLKAPWRPGEKLPPIEVNVVEAREIGTPYGVEPIHWFLITSLSIENFSDVMKVIGIYTKRWLIEEYHKALKTGAGIEKSQLEEAERLKNLLGILGVVAVRLLNSKLLAVSKSEEVVNPEEVGGEIIKILEVRFGKPKEGWTYKYLIERIARLGGFLGRRGDGNPGWITIWRGWHRLVDMVEGYNLAIAMEG